MQMPYATSVTLLNQAGIHPEAAHEIASLYQDLEFETSEAALKAVQMFSEVYSHHPKAAMNLLKNAHEVKTMNFS